jgi:hypothetical protein
MTAIARHVTGDDPDSPGAQPDGAVEALIAPVEAEVRELQFPGFSLDGAARHPWVGAV